MKILLLWSERGGFQFLWILVLWGATYNAAIVVGMVSLLLLKLSLAILCAKLQFWFHYNEFGPILMVVSGAKPIIRPAFLPRPSATFYNVTVPSAL